MKKLFIYKLLIVLVMILVGIYFYGILPEQVPSHWWPNGLPDAYSSKILNIVLFPILTLLMVILFPVLSKIDPKKENYEKFSKVWEIIQFSIILFFAYIYFVILYLSANPNLSITTYMMFWLWFLFIILWNYFWKIKQNYFIWIKLPWTLSNEDVWNKTHRLSWKLFVFAGILFIINWFINFFPIFLFIFSLIFILIIPILYSYIIFNKINKL